MQKELKKMEISNLPNKEFKVRIIKMIKEIKRRLDEESKKLKVFNKELKYKEAEFSWGFRIQHCHL